MICPHFRPMKCLQFQQLKMKSRNIKILFLLLLLLLMQGISKKILAPLPTWKDHGNRENALKKSLEMQKKESNSANSPLIRNSQTV